MPLADKQWEFLVPLFPPEELEGGRPGRPFRDAREVLDGVLWVLRTGAQWNEMPSKFPPYQTCHRRFQKWVEHGLMEKILRALAEDLRDRGKLDLSEAYIDGTHAGAKKGGLSFGKTRRGKATKIMAVADRSGFPLAVGIASGQRNEVKLVDETLDAAFLDELPPRLIGDRAYDSDGLDAALLDERNIEMIAPHHPRRRRLTQDGRPLRRYRRRWLVERIFAWLQNFRRLLTRHERKASNFLGFVQLGCILILLRGL
ncbi:MAG: IS5 family transposase [Myxococcota bacterium]